MDRSYSLGMDFVRGKLGRNLNYTATPSYEMDQRTTVTNNNKGISLQMLSSYAVFQDLLMVKKCMLDVLIFF